jgi:mannobiose 2-epimerase
MKINIFEGEYNLVKFEKELEAHLLKNILPFWMNNAIDEENGGFYGFIDNYGEPDKTHFKSGVLNSRILWTFSKAYNKYKDKKFLDCAEIAYNFLIKYFYDEKYSGLYWSVEYNGKVRDERKQLYNIAFGIYGLSEYYMATKSEKVLGLAIELFKVIENHAYDKDNLGYIEALKRDFSQMSDLRLSPKDLNEKKSMNTHLHILESYTNLLRVWRDDSLILKQKELINVFISKIIDKKDFRQKLFFDEHWNSKTDMISYGHDIECSWLIYEAVLVLNDDKLIKDIKNVSINMAKKVFDEAIDNNNSLINERENNEMEKVRIWWPQAEAMVGFFNLFQLTDNKSYYDIVLKLWEYLKINFIDEDYGEWYSIIDEKGIPRKDLPKVDPWKCPYHNSRAILELLERINNV